MVLKFRAYDRKYKSMDDVFQLEWWNDELRVNDDTFGDYVIMQSTGLHDRNGVEIFEGDIVEHIDFNSNEISKSEVRILKGCFYLVISVDGFKYDVPMMDLKDDECIFEIKGNVHENPELPEDI